MQAQVQNYYIPCVFVFSKVTLRQISCLSNLVLLILKFHQLGPGITGPFVITEQKASSSYTHNKKELHEGTTATCNISNLL
jgi:hypothetical protein